MSEHKIQNDARNALAGQCMLFRANVGTGWTGDVTRLPDGSIHIRNPRPFSTGLPEGFSDTFGLVQVRITQDMVGREFGRFIALEFKGEGKKPTTLQANFLQAVNSYGGTAGVCRSVEGAKMLLHLAKSGVVPFFKE
jgi:hypothetical protein